VREGVVAGRFVATGVTPRFLTRMKARGIALDAAMFTAGPLATGSKK
jgi:hypothetical protein